MLGAGKSLGSMLASPFPFCGGELPISTCCSPCDAHELRPQPEAGDYQEWGPDGTRFISPGVGNKDLEHRTEIEIIVSVDRQPGQSWGVDVHHGGVRGLIVDKVVQGGVLDRHNNANEMKVFSKDRIVEVNGRGRGNAAVLLEECRRSEVTHIDLVIARPAVVPRRHSAVPSLSSATGYQPPHSGCEAADEWTSLLPSMPGWMSSLCSREPSRGPPLSRDSENGGVARYSHDDGDTPSAWPDSNDASMPSSTKTLGGYVCIRSMSDLNNTRLNSTHLVIDCYERWHAVCQRNAPILELLTKHQNSITFATVDINEVRDVAGELNVAATPTVFFVHRGAFVERLPGIGPENFRHKIEQFISNFVLDAPTEETGALLRQREGVAKVQTIEGVETYPDGSAYRGQMREGLRHGRGTWEHSAGFFSGNWRDDQFCGHGVQMYADGRRYSGQFSKGQYHGDGVMEWISDHGRMSYVGQYVNGLKSGEGKFSWADGRSYSGYWHDGKRHGIGACATPEGKIQLGEWHLDKLVKWLPDVNKAEDWFVRQGGSYMVGDDLMTGISREEAKDYVKQHDRAFGFAYRNDEPEECFVKWNVTRFEANEAWTTITRLKLDDDLAQKLVRAVPVAIRNVTVKGHGPALWSAMSWSERWALLAPRAPPEVVRDVARDAMDALLQKARQASTEAAMQLAADPSTERPAQLARRSLTSVYSKLTTRSNPIKEIARQVVLELYRKLAARHEGAEIPFASSHKSKAPSLQLPLAKEVLRHAYQQIVLQQAFHPCG